jgi:hypothetical protein
MKAAQIEEARAILALRSTNVALRDRLAGGEPLRLTIGSANAVCEIVLSPGYAAEIRSNLLKAFDARIAENDAALSERGVEP